MKKQLKLKIGILFCLASFICSSVVFASEKIVIGTILPLSGPISVVGVALKRGFEMRLEKINAQGGIEINGKKFQVEMIAEDTKMSPGASSSSALKLIHKDGAKIIYGGIIESNIDAIYKVTKKEGVFYAIASVNIPGHPADVSGEKPNLVRLGPSFDDSHTIDIDYLAKSYPSAKNIVISAPDIGYEGMIKDLETKASKNGLSVTSVVKWSFGTTDFLPVFIKIIAAKPDVIFAMVSGQGPYQLMAARQLGFKGTFIANAPMGPDIFTAIAGKSSCDNLITNGVDLGNPTSEMKDVMDRWKKKYNEPFIGDSFLAWDGAGILLKAIGIAQSLDPEKLTAAFESLNKPGDIDTIFGKAKATGKDRFGANRVLSRPVSITHMKKGDVVFSDFVNP
ncbi:ABC transporter substrate-binding protein [Desulfobacula sp.]|uniref:ABC transporter substrate-binding protein n=1 Tax=Desulfobacula sp. TaxID=2593537 RepID=UPI00262F4BD1|nr:ABC transporter substrate-binding protein [Desulfobacula sp.]